MAIIRLIKIKINWCTKAVIGKKLGSLLRRRWRSALKQSLLMISSILMETYIPTNTSWQENLMNKQDRKRYSYTTWPLVGSQCHSLRFIRAEAHRSRTKMNLNWMIIKTMSRQYRAVPSLTSSKPSMIRSACSRANSMTRNHVNSSIMIVYYRAKRWTFTLSKVSTVIVIYQGFELLKSVMIRSLLIIRTILSPSLPLPRTKRARDSFKVLKVFRWRRPA